MTMGSRKNWWDKNMHICKFKCISIIIHLSIYLSIYQSIYLSIHLSLSLSLCLNDWLFNIFQEGGLTTTNWVKSRSLASDIWRSSQRSCAVLRLGRNLPEQSCKIPGSWDSPGGGLKLTWSFPNGWGYPGGWFISWKISLKLMRYHGRKHPHVAEISWNIRTLTGGWSGII